MPVQGNSGIEEVIHAPADSSYPGPFEPNMIAWRAASCADGGRQKGGVGWRVRGGRAVVSL